MRDSPVKARGDTLFDAIQVPQHTNPQTLTFAQFAQGIFVFTPPNLLTNYQRHYLETWLSSLRETLRWNGMSLTSLM